MKTIRDYSWDEFQALSFEEKSALLAKKDDAALGGLYIDIHKGTRLNAASNSEDVIRCHADRL